MSDNTENLIINEIIKNIDIPDSAYETAEKRYKDLGEWLGRENSSCAKYSPHIFPQGSFRLGTVIRPNGGEEYDLDISSKLREGVAKGTHSQEELKNLIGEEVESYRKHRGIEEKLEEKRRCWRLNYKDDINFHLDIVPCIPEEEHTRRAINESMIRKGTTASLAEMVSELTVAITDNEEKHYHSICNNWRISNPEGYALWFESRMKQVQQLLEERAFEAKVSVDELPVYRWKTPLQRCVQILKRHRDTMFADYPDGKPISIIITTLAAKAYQGEAEVAEAMANILDRMGSLVSTTEPRIPNPVNPAEDFADKWVTEEGRKMRLEENFNLWLKQAKEDFKNIISNDDMDFIESLSKEKYGVSLRADELRKITGIAAPSIIVKPDLHTITEAPARPHLR